jgi:hypothetical protein
VKIWLTTNKSGNWKGSAYGVLFHLDDSGSAHRHSSFAFQPVTKWLAYFRAFCKILDLFCKLFESCRIIF